MLWEHSALYCRNLVWIVHITSLLCFPPLALFFITYTYVSLGDLNNKASRTGQAGRKKSKKSMVLYNICSREELSFFFYIFHWKAERACMRIAISKNTPQTPEVASGIDTQLCHPRRQPRKLHYMPRLMVLKVQLFHQHSKEIGGNGAVTIESICVICWNRCSNKAQTALNMTFRNVSVMDSRRGGELQASDYAFQR